METLKLFSWFAVILIRVLMDRKGRKYSTYLPIQKPCSFILFIKRLIPNSKKIQYEHICHITKGKKVQGIYPPPK